MGYGVEAAGFRPERRARQSLAREIAFPLAGEAPRGFWNRKNEFGAEIVCENVHSVLRETRSVEELRYIRRSEMETLLEEAPIKRRAFHLAAFQNTPFPHPQTVFWGEEVAVAVYCGDAASQRRFRHADAYTVGFVHRGKGRVTTDFGILAFEEGDFIYLPRSTTYRLEGSGDFCLLLYEFPQRVLRARHSWIEGYPFVDTALVPAEPEKVIDPPDGPGVWEVWVKRHHGKWTLMSYPFSPFDAVAWEGEAYPFVLHLRDLRALSSPDFHLDPKALTVFLSEDGRASIQAFLPRWVHSLPYPHQNHVDEVLFNHRGYQARPEVKDGYATLHPAGTFHSPDIRALHQRRGQSVASKAELPWRNEVAVLLESSSRLAVLPEAETVEVADYEGSWYRQYQELQEASRAQG